MQNYLFYPDPIDPTSNNINREPSSDSLSVDNFVEKTSQQIPEMMENLQKLRSQATEYKKESEDRRYSLSYQAWNLDNYFMVREIVTGVVESAVDQAEEGVRLEHKDSFDMR